MKYLLESAWRCYDVYNPKQAIQVDNAQYQWHYHGGTMYFTFAGSNDVSDWVGNLDAKLVNWPLMPNVQVHRGIHDHFEHLLVHVADTINEFRESKGVIDAIRFEGHSLGGAVASMFGALEWDVKDTAAITFGSPRVFGRGVSSSIGTRVTRVVNDGDMVPHVPTMWRFTHIGTGLRLSEGGNLRADNHFKAFIDLAGIRAETAVKAHSMMQYIYRLTLSHKNEQGK